MNESWLSNIHTILLLFSGSCNPVLSPSNNITSFVGNDTAVFNCTGYGSNIFWLVDGQSTNAQAIQRRGVKVAVAAINGSSSVHSTLTIPKTGSNNGTEVKCLVIDYGSSVLTSGTVKLALQGTKFACLWNYKWDTCMSWEIEQVNKKLLSPESDLLNVELVVQKARKQGTVLLQWGLQ